MIKFYTCFAKSAPEMVQMMKESYKEKWLHERTIFHWHKAFNEGCESAALIPRGGQPSPACTEIN